MDKHNIVVITLCRYDISLAEIREKLKKQRVYVCKK